MLVIMFKNLRLVSIIIFILLPVIVIPVSYVSYGYWHIAGQSFSSSGYPEELRQEYTFLRWAAIGAGLSHNALAISTIKYLTTPVYDRAASKLGQNQADKQIFLSWIQYAPYIAAEFVPPNSNEQYLISLTDLSRHKSISEYGENLFVFDAAFYAATLLRRSFGSIETATGDDLKNIINKSKAASVEISNISKRIDCSYILKTSDLQGNNANRAVNFFTSAFSMWDTYIHTSKRASSPNKCETFPDFLVLADSLKGCISAFEASDSKDLHQLTDLSNFLGSKPSLRNHIKICGEQMSYDER